MTKIISSFTGEHYFLSNFWTGYPKVSMASLGYGGAFADSAEHAFQAHKSTDPRQQAIILAARTPKIAKQLGRQVRPLPPWWEDRKREIMLECLLAKFSVPELRQRLAATGNAILIEGNQWGDDYWGAVAGEIGKATVLPCWAASPGDRSYVLYGHNWLGRLLMVVREITT